MLSNWANGVVFDAKFITSVVVGAVGTAATILRNLREISQGRSKRAREKLETANVAELLDLLPKVRSDDSLSACKKELCKKELEVQLDQSLKALEALRAKDELAPNHDLTLLQRLFVVFPPRPPNVWIIHALAYMFLAGGPLVILMLVLFQIGGAGSIGDVTVMCVFGSLAFRMWALAERKWAKPADRSAPPMQMESGPLQTLFVLRKSKGWKMLVAQICMWTCLFCAVESLEDIFLAGLDASNAATQGAAKTAQDDAKAGLLLFLTSLLGSGICRAWASAEWRHGSTPSHTTLAKALFPWPKPATLKAWLLTASYVGAMELLIVSVVKWPLIFKDSLDRIEFSFVWMAACIACNRLLSSLANVADHPMEDKPAAQVLSAAA